MPDRSACGSLMDSTSALKAAWPVNHAGNSYAEGKMPNPGSPKAAELQSLPSLDSHSTVQLISTAGMPYDTVHQSLNLDQPSQPPTASSTPLLQATNGANVAKHWHGSDPPCDHQQQAQNASKGNTWSGVPETSPTFKPSTLKATRTTFVKPASSIDSLSISPSTMMMLRRFRQSSKP